MTSRENISYIVPRDPSIKCWNDRVKLPEPCTKNLIQLGSEEFEDTMGDTIKVYLRLKPSTSPENPYTVLTPTMLQTEAPKESVSYKNVKNGVGKLIHKFTFTSILSHYVTQAELFRISVVKNLQNFLSGKNYLLMAYGTTSAGKTYTMQGNVLNPGVIPRALEFVFTTLKESIIPVCRYIPYQYKELLVLSEDQLKKNQLHKNFILSLDLSKCQRYPGGSQTTIITNSTSGFSDYYENVTFKEMQSNLTETDCFEIDSEAFKYSVWISMIEIYNEQVYDLLEVPNSKGERPKLIFRDDEYGHTFVRNLRYVNVSSGHEAFQILQFGRSNLHLAPTALNNKSSRSHCIFTITVAKFLEYNLSSQAIISRFSFCDLAGMERAKKTLNVKDRLVESKAINTSLSILAKCLTTIKENQNSNDKKMIPYRESKLTKLFRDNILGKERFSIIVNVTTEPNLFDETLNVLKFSAIAQEIVTQNVFAKPVISRSRFSRIVINSSCNKRTIDWEASTIDTTKVKEETSDSGVEDRQDSIEILKYELEREKKRSEEIETLVREELTSKFSEMLKKQDENNELRLENESERLKKMYEKKEKRIIDYYEKLRQKKRPKLEEDVSDDEDQNERFKEIEEISKKLNSENDTLKQNLQQLIVEKNKLLSECSELKFKLVEKDRSLEALQRANEANDAGADELVRELRKQLDIANATIADFKTLLNEAASDYMELEEINKGLRKEKETLERGLIEHREAVADLRNENAELQKILSQRRVLIEKLEDANEEMKKNLKAGQEVEEELNEEKIPFEEFRALRESFSNKNEILKGLSRAFEPEVKILTAELENHSDFSEIEKAKVATKDAETKKNLDLKEEYGEETKAREIEEHGVVTGDAGNRLNTPPVKNKKKVVAEPVTEAITIQIQNLSLHQPELRSTRKKVDLLGESIHPSSLRNTHKGRKKKEDKGKEEKKVMENEKENHPASKKKNKCFRKLFIENDFDDFVDLNVSPLEEMPRLRPRLATVYAESEN